MGCVKMKAGDKTKQDAFLCSVSGLMFNNEFGKLRAYLRAADKNKQEKYNTLAPQTQELVNIFGPQNAMKRMQMAIKRDKYRPRNMTRFQFAAMDYLDKVAGKFSTFDVALRKMQRDGTAARDVRKYISKNVNNQQEVIDYYLHHISDILRRKKQLVRQAIASGSTGDLEPWNTLFRTIADEMQHRMKIDDVMLDVSVVDNKRQARYFSTPMRAAVKSCVENGGNGFHAKLQDMVDNRGISYIVINRGGIVRAYPKSGGADLFRKMLSTFAHEYGHFVDDVAPEYGMIGAQQVLVSNKVYVQSDDDYEQYMKNPLELSSRMVGDYVYKHLSGHNK